MSIQNTDKSRQAHKQFWVWAVLLAVIVLTSAIRIRLLAVPLERDEGEYAYAGQLMLQGVPPYEKAYNMKMPGIYAAYALILAIFGQTHVGIHLGLLFVNAVTAVLVFLLAKKLFDPIVGLFAGAAFALLCVGPWVQGASANAEHFVLPFAIAGILLLYKPTEPAKLFSVFIAGLLLGVAFLMKQHGAAFIVFGGLYLLLGETRRKPFNWKLFSGRIFLFSIGVFLPFILTCFILWHFGVFERFWFWTFDYARHYVARMSLNTGLFNLEVTAIRAIVSAICLWVLAGVGLIFLFRFREFRKQSLFVTGFLMVSFLSVCPGLYFRPHYFILLLPAVSLLAGIGAAGICDIFGRFKSVFAAKAAPIILSLAVLIFTLCEQRRYFFTADALTISKVMYGENPFPESLEIGSFIKQNSQSNDTIAVIGSEPQIYFYSGRRSATGYIYTYALMEKQPYAAKMLEEMIGQIEQARPKFIILVGTPTSWSAIPDQIWELFKRYPLKGYQMVGIADILPAGKTIYRWGKQAAEYTLQSDSWMAVYRDKRYGDADNIVRTDTGKIDSTK